MKMLIIAINDYIDKKKDIVFNWALNNNITNIYILSNGFDKEKLLNLKEDLPSNGIGIKMYLDYKDSFKLSENDLKSFSREDLSFDVIVMDKYNVNNKRINIINNNYKKIDFLNILETSKEGYDLFVFKDNSFRFDFQLNHSMKSVLVGVPYLNNNNDFLVVDTSNNRIDGYHLIIDNDIVKKEVLFKI